MILRKICLLGEVAVGKTSLVRRYVDRQFSDSYLSTVGVKISRKVITVPGAGELQLILWDLEGGSNPRVASPSYLKGAHGAVIVADLTRPATLDAVTTHMETFHRINPAGVVIVALNKSDLVTGAESVLAQWNGRSDGPAALLTSARLGGGVDTVFETIGAHLAEGAVHGSAD